MSKLIRFFAATREVNVWHVYSQSWTGRVSATSAFRDDRLMASLAQTERLRIARMASYRGFKPAALWWAQNATRRADKAASRQYQ